MRNQNGWLIAAAVATAGFTACKGGGDAGDVQGATTEITIDAVFDAQTVSGRAGGSESASSHGGNCVGNIPVSPHHSLTVSASTEATIAVTSEADTTLVVVGDDGAQCDDDTNGLNPELRGRFDAGTYQIYVGTFDSDVTTADYTLTISPAATQDGAEEPEGRANTGVDAGGVPAAANNLEATDAPFQAPPHNGEQDSEAGAGDGGERAAPGGSAPSSQPAGD